MAAPRGTDTKHLILKSAENLISRRQVEAISLQDIASEAGISKGTLYYYYTSKQLVLLDLVEMYLNTLADDFIKWIENKDKDTSLRRLIYYVIERGVDTKRGKMHIYLINHSLSKANFNIRKKFLDVYHEWSIMLKQSIMKRCESEDAEMIANILVFMLDGLLIRQLIDDKPFDYMKIAEFLSKKTE